MVPSGGISPLHCRAVVYWRTKEGEDGYTAVVGAAARTVGRGIGSDRARVLWVWGGDVSPRPRRGLAQGTQRFLRMRVRQDGYPRRPGRWDSLRHQKGATEGQHHGSPRRCARLGGAVAQNSPLAWTFVIPFMRPYKFCLTGARLWLGIYRDGCWDGLYRREPAACLRGIRYSAGDGRDRYDLDHNRATGGDYTQRAVEEVAAVVGRTAVPLAGRRRDERHTRWKEVLEPHVLGRGVIRHHDRKGNRTPHGSRVGSGLMGNAYIFTLCLVTPRNLL